MSQQEVIIAPPHIRTTASVPGVMWSVVSALIPAIIGGVYFFGLRALLIIALSTVAAVILEAFTQVLLRRPVTIYDGSAVITGILVGLVLPPRVPLWLPIVGAAIAIIMIKQLFGGLGHNLLNPALAGRVFLQIMFPSYLLTRFSSPVHGSITGGIDAVTQATPLMILKNTASVLSPPGNSPLWTDFTLKTVNQLNSLPVLKNLFFGNVGGSIGETSSLLLLVGAFFLLALRIIDFRIPLSYLATVVILSLVLPTPASPIFHLFSGGLILGAFFMATDYTTTPLTKLGVWLFGIGCGVLTVLFRIWGIYPEGVAFAIVLMNLTTPLLDTLTRPKILGAG